MDRPERLIIIPYGIFPAPLNMAIDEVLFVEAQKTGDSYLRFYGWDRPSVTFGYFQRPDEQLTDSRACVRRLTGGGTVLHDGDLTFSLCGPSQPPFSTSRAIYQAVGRAALDSLSSLFSVGGLESVHKGAPHGRFYSCFDVPSSDDILLNGRKIYGGAIRRTKSAFLLQGTLSRKLPRSKTPDFIKSFSTGIAREFKESARRRILKQTMKKARALAEEKYGQEAWNFPGKRTVLR